MFDVFKDAALCKYRRNVVTTVQKRTPNGVVPSVDKVLEFKHGVPVIKGNWFFLQKSDVLITETVNFENFSGIVRDSIDGSISLTNVPIVTPNCELIVSNLNINVSRSTTF